MVVAVAVVNERSATAYFAKRGCAAGRPRVKAGKGRRMSSGKSRGRGCRFVAYYNVKVTRNRKDEQVVSVVRLET